jgi:hypothetical protein
MASGIRILLQMAKPSLAHRRGILAYDDAMISSGPMEGTINRIRTTKRQAYGFMELFKLKIPAIHDTRYGQAGYIGSSLVRNDLRWRPICAATFR